MKSRARHRTPMVLAQRAQSSTLGEEDQGKQQAEAEGFVFAEDVSGTHNGIIKGCDGVLKTGRRGLGTSVKKHIQQAEQKKMVCALLIKAIWTFKSEEKMKLHTDV